MKIVRAGFSLLECTIYCAMLVMISVLVMNSVTSLQQGVAAQGVRTNRLTELYAALDVMVRDVQNMRGGLKQQELSRCAWQCSDAEDVGWACEGERLMRTQGRCDVKRGWQSSTKNNALSGVKHFSLEPVYLTDGQRGKQRIVGMQIMLTTQESFQEKQFVAVYDRELA